MLPKNKLLLKGYKRNVHPISNHTLKLDHLICLIVDHLNFHAINHKTETENEMK